MRYAAIIAFTVLTVAQTAFAADTVKVSPPQQKTLSAPNGRYVFGQISEFRRDRYMLDTQTGRLWIIATRQRDGDGSMDGEDLLYPVRYLNTQGVPNILPH